MKSNGKFQKTTPPSRRKNEKREKLNIVKIFRRKKINVDDNIEKISGGLFLYFLDFFFLLFKVYRMSVKLFSCLIFIRHYGY